MEVSGKRSEDHGNTQDLCEPCQIENISTPAAGFCADCSEYMCQQCFHDHLKSRLSRNHVLETARTGTLQTQFVLQADYCEAHATEKIKYYCRTHNFVGCGDCMIPEHVECKPEQIANIAKDVETSLELRNIFQQIASVDAELENNETMLKRNKKKNESCKSKALHKLKQFSKEIRGHIDKMEKEISARVQEITKENNTRLEESETEIASMKMDITGLKTQLDTSLYSGESLFIRMMQCKSKLSKLQSDITLMKSKNKVQMYSFEPETKWKDLFTTEVCLHYLRMLQHSDEDSNETGVSAKNVSKPTKKETAAEVNVPMKIQRTFRYPKGQWSPLNPNGKKNYSRAFLLQFRNDPLALRKPKGLRNIPEIIHKKPEIQHVSEQDFTPTYSWGTGSENTGLKEQTYEQVTHMKKTAANVLFDDTPCDESISSPTVKEMNVTDVPQRANSVLPDKSFLQTGGQFNMNVMSQRFPSPVVTGINYSSSNIYTHQPQIGSQQHNTFYSGILTPQIMPAPRYKPDVRPVSGGYFHQRSPGQSGVAWYGNQPLFRAPTTQAQQPLFWTPPNPVEKN